MVTVADLAGAAAGAAAVLAIALAALAVRAYQATGSRRNVYLGAAFLASGIQAVLTAWLLLKATQLDTAWLSVPVMHALTMVLLYVALMRG